MAPITVDGLDVDDATIDGDVVDEITMDGDVVFTRVPDIPDSVIYHAEFSEGSGTTVSDSVGNLDADFNSISWQSDAGLEGFYGELDGTDDFGSLGSASHDVLTHFPQNEPATFNLWIKPDSITSRGHYFGNRFRTATVGFGGEVSDGDLTTYIVDGSGSTLASTGGSPTNWNDGDWTAVAVTTDGGELNVYGATPANNYNLENVATTSFGTGTTDDLTHDIEIGRDGHNGGRRYFGGGIDDIRYHNVERSQSELQDWVDSTKSNYE